ANQRMIGNLRLGGEILRARYLIGENRSEQIVRPHAKERRRDFRAAAETQDGQRARRVPPPTRSEHGSGKHCLLQSVFQSLWLQKFEDELERERVAFRERDEKAVIGGGRLELEVKSTAEFFAE